MTAVYARAEGALAAEVDGEMVLMAPVDCRCFALRGPADRVWQLLEEPRTAPAIVDALTREFPVDAERCEREIDDLLAQMTTAGLVSQAP